MPPSLFFLLCPSKECASWSCLSLFWKCVSLLTFGIPPNLAGRRLTLFAKTYVANLKKKFAIDFSHFFVQFLVAFLRPLPLEEGMQEERGGGQGGRGRSRKRKKKILQCHCFSKKEGGERRKKSCGLLGKNAAKPI